MTHTSVGQQLAHARSEKGLSLDQAAHLTKIRPDKLAALEADDFSAFPNNTYARGFLLIYGKFLHVDVGELASKLENDNPISVDSYQYLSAPNSEEPDQRARMRPRETRSKRPSIAPLVVFIVLVVFIGLGIHFFTNTQRLGNLERTGRAAQDDDTAPGASLDAPPAEAPPDPNAPTLENPAFSGVAPADGDAARITADPPPPAPQPDPVPTAKTPGPNELSVDPVKKSWVRIRRDDPISEPVFDDFLYPGVGPLKIRGTRFYIEVRDDGIVQLRKNGEPLAYHPPGIVVQ